jgi:hypothetical protein
VNGVTSLTLSVLTQRLAGKCARWKRGFQSAALVQTKGFGWRFLTPMLSRMARSNSKVLR